MARKEATKRGGRGHGYAAGGFGSADYNPGPSVDMSASHQPSKPAYNPPRCNIIIYSIVSLTEINKKNPMPRIGY